MVVVAPQLGTTQRGRPGTQVLQSTGLCDTQSGGGGSGAHGQSAHTASEGQTVSSMQIVSKVPPYQRKKQSKGSFLHAQAKGQQSV